MFAVDFTANKPLRGSVTSIFPAYLHYKHCTTILQVLTSLVYYYVQDATLFSIYRYIGADNLP
jgi:hypothetical protein